MLMAHPPGANLLYWKLLWPPWRSELIIFAEQSLCLACDEDSICPCVAHICCSISGAALGLDMIDVNNLNN